MITLLLAALLLVQGIPVTAAQSGTITGILRAPDGTPLAGVRVAAVIQPETAEDRAIGAMSSLAETDELGRFRIEGVPQGRYYVAAGRVDYPTYYPGTLEMSLGRIVSVMPGTIVSGIDFAMGDVSERPLVAPGLGIVSLTIKLSVPLKVTMSGGGRVPLFAEGKFPMVKLISPSNSIAPAARLGDGIIEAAGADYDVQVESLPSGYAVQSITYNGVDVRTAKIRIPYAFASATGTVVTLSGSTAKPVPPLSTITIVLQAPPAATTATGVRVSGRVRDRITRSVYLSGTPGTYYSDGSFEFVNVPPGLHVIAGLDTPDPLGVFVVVGNQNVDGIELRDDTAILPFNLRSPRDPEPAGTRAPSSVLPLPSLKGVVVEEESKKPIGEGTVKITGYARSQPITIGSDGRFEIPRLFPGSYTIDFEAFGHAAVTETVTVGVENITLDLASRRLY